MGIPEELQEDREFFLGYRQKFGEVFLESLQARGEKILSKKNMEPLVDKLYAMLFSFTRDPVEELGELSYQLAKLGINISTALSKALLRMLKDYIDYVIENGLPHSRVKDLVMLIDTYISAVEGAYARYIAELRRKAREEKERVEGERQIAIEFFEKQFVQGNVDIEIITYYKEVPVVCRSKIIRIHEETLRVKSCEFKVFEVEKEVFVKHINLPRPVAVVIRDIDRIGETMDLEIIGFRDLPQERRRYVRVVPKTPVSVTLKKGDWKAVGSMADISVGGVGVYFRDTDDLKLGDVVRISFSLPKGEIKTDALIRHITPREDVFRVGMSYELDLKQEEIVSDYVMERQFEILKELKGS